MAIDKFSRSLRLLRRSSPTALRTFSSTTRHDQPANRRSQSAQIVDFLRPDERSQKQPSRSERGLGILDSISTRMQPQGSLLQSIRDDTARIELAKRSKQVERQQIRSWKQGDVYAPHDLSAQEMKKWNRAQRPSADVFDVLNINPLDEYKNLPLMMDFMTDMGRIKHQKETGLRPVNQRKIAKAVRRAICMGFLPRVHAHPEMLRRPGPWSRRG